VSSNAADVQGGRTATVDHKRSGETPERAKNKSRTDEDGEDRNAKREQEDQVKKEIEDRGERDQSENLNERKKGKKCEENTRTVYAGRI